MSSPEVGVLDEFSVVDAWSEEEDEEVGDKRTKGDSRKPTEGEISEFLERIKGESKDDKRDRPRGRITRRDSDKTHREVERRPIRSYRRSRTPKRRVSPIRRRSKSPQVLRRPRRTADVRTKSPRRSRSPLKEKRKQDISPRKSAPVSKPRDEHSYIHVMGPMNTNSRYFNRPPTQPNGSFNPAMAPQNVSCLPPLYGNPPPYHQNGVQDTQYAFYDQTHYPPAVAPGYEPHSMGLHPPQEIHPGYPPPLQQEVQDYRRPSLNYPPIQPEPVMPTMSFPPPLVPPPPPMISTPQFGTNDSRHYNSMPSPPPPPVLTGCEEIKPFEESAAKFLDKLLGKRKRREQKKVRVRSFNNYVKLLENKDIKLSSLLQALSEPESNVKSSRELGRKVDKVRKKGAFAPDLAEIELGKNQSLLVVWNSLLEFNHSSKVVQVWTSSDRVEEDGETAKEAEYSQPTVEAPPSYQNWQPAECLNSPMEPPQSMSMLYETPSDPWAYLKPPPLMGPQPHVIPQPAISAPRNALITVDVQPKNQGKRSRKRKIKQQPLPHHKMQRVESMPIVLNPGPKLKTSSQLVPIRLQPMNELAEDQHLPPKPAPPKEPEVRKTIQINLKSPMKKPRQTSDPEIELVDVYMNSPTSEGFPGNPYTFREDDRGPGQKMPQFDSNEKKENERWPIWGGDGGQGKKGTRVLEDQDCTLVEAEQSLLKGRAQSSWALPQKGQAQSNSAVGKLAQSHLKGQPSWATPQPKEQISLQAQSRGSVLGKRTLTVFGTKMEVPTPKVTLQFHKEPKSSLVLIQAQQQASSTAAQGKLKEQPATLQSQSKGSKQQITFQSQVKGQGQASLSRLNVEAPSVHCPSKGQKPPITFQAKGQKQPISFQPQAKGPRATVTPPGSFQSQKEQTSQAQSKGQAQPQLKEVKQPSSFQSQNKGQTSQARSKVQTQPQSKQEKQPSSLQPQNRGQANQAQPIGLTQSISSQAKGQTQATSLQSKEPTPAVPQAIKTQTQPISLQSQGPSPAVHQPNKTQTQPISLQSQTPPQSKAPVVPQPTPPTNSGSAPLQPIGMQPQPKAPQAQTESGPVGKLLYSKVRDLQLSNPSTKCMIDAITSDQSNKTSKDHLMRGGMLCKKYGESWKIVIPPEMETEFIVLVHSISKPHTSNNKMMVTLEKYFSPITEAQNKVNEAVNKCDECQQKA